MSSLKFIVNKRRKTYRLAIVVNKKVNKSAVARNRIRRRLYEVIRGLEDQITEPYDLVLTVFNTRFGDLPSDEVSQLIEDQLIDAGVIKNLLTN